MSKKIIFIFLAFFLSLFYLHQRVMIYTQAYKLNDACETYNKLVDSRDILLYNFSQATSLDKINSWVQANGFKVAQESKVLALDMANQGGGLRYKKNNILVSSFNRIFRLSGISRALAQERR